jgi:TolB-like protein/Tfp pilus assembly protein PilF
MPFLDELKQRKVVRVAIGYLVAAWLGIQVASIALPAFDAPGWVLRVLILLLALGFPLALVLTWAIDLTPDGPRFVPGGTGWRRLVAISLALVALAIGWYVFGQPSWRFADLAGAPKADEAPVSAAPARSIAVLPFVNMSRDPANEYFSDGLAETTLDMLAQVHDLKVIARTSSFAFKGKAADVREIGRKLDAAHLLEGSVQQSGQTVRITAQLVRTSDGVHLWSHRYDRQLTDVFAIQDEIATEVVKALQLALPKAQAARVTGKRTDDVAAYKEYLRGVALLPDRRVTDMREALGHFQKAIALDPDYARAYAQGAIALGLLHNYTGGATDQEQALRRQYVDTALRLDPGLGEGYAVRGALCEESGDFACAEENYRRANELAPNFSTGWQWYGELAAVQLGQPARSLALMRRARQLDPLSSVIRTEYATALAENGDRAGALREVDAVLRDNPRSALGHSTRAEFLETEGDLPGALRAYRALFAVDPEAVARRALPCETMIDFGAFAEARACIEAVPEPRGEDLTSSARRHLAAATGDWGEALRLARHPRRPDPWAEVLPMLALGQHAQALARLQKLDPGMFLQPEPRLSSSYAGDALMAAAALIGSGAKAQGLDLVRRNLAANAGKPINQLRTGRGWTDVDAWVLLGDYQKACAATREVVAAGVHTQLWRFDSVPQLAPLREQPCFREAIAPARAEAARQVEAARAAGLL